MELEEALSKVPNECPECHQHRFSIFGEMIDNFTQHVEVIDGKAKAGDFDTVGDTYGQEQIIFRVKHIDCEECGTTVLEA